MTDLFASPKRPFFRSTEIMKLEKIEKMAYRDFIISMFNHYKKQISTDIAEAILDWANQHTYYVQLLCNKVFAETKSRVDPGLWKTEAAQILKEQELLFYNYRNMLTKPQWHLLKAIAKDQQVFKPTSHLFIQRHRLGTSATILRSLKTLLDYELVYYDTNEKGEKYYSVYDVLLQRWSEGQ